MIKVYDNCFVAFLTLFYLSDNFSDFFPDSVDHPRLFIRQFSFFLHHFFEFFFYTLKRVQSLSATAFFFNSILLFGLN